MVAAMTGLGLPNLSNQTVLAGGMVSLDSDLQSGFEQACRGVRANGTQYNVPPDRGVVNVIHALFIIEQIRRNR